MIVQIKWIWIRILKWMILLIYQEADAKSEPDSVVDTGGDTDMTAEHCSWHDRGRHGASNNVAPIPSIRNLSFPVSPRTTFISPQALLHQAANNT